MSSTTTRSARSTRAIALLTVSSARWRRSSMPRSSRVYHAYSARSRRPAGRGLRAGTSSRCPTGRRRRGFPGGAPTPGCAAPVGSAPGSRTRRVSTTPGTSSRSGTLRQRVGWPTPTVRGRRPLHRTTLAGCLCSVPVGSDEPLLSRTTVARVIRRELSGPRHAGDGPTLGPRLPRPMPVGLQTAFGVALRPIAASPGCRRLGTGWLSPPRRE